MISKIQVFSLLFLIYSLNANSSPVNIRLMTYNIRHGLNMKQKIDLSAIANIIKDLNPDLVAIQELDKTTNRTHGVDELQVLANMTRMNYYFSPAMTYDGGYYGVGVLSKTPIDYNISYQLPQHSVAEPRTVGIIQTNISGQEILFASTHLDAKQDSTNRLLQVNKLISIFNETDSNIPVIVAGDFNAKPNSQEVIDMKQQFIDISEHLGNTFPSDIPNRKIDYVFILSKFKNNFKLIDGQVVNETIASDHRPVFVNLQFDK